MTLTEYLQETRLITHTQAQEALRLSASYGTSIPRTLLSMGVVNSKTLYHAIAAYHGTEFVDLITVPEDIALLRTEHINDYHRLNAIPWKKEAGRITIVTPEITPTLITWANATYQKGYRFTITSPYDIHHALQHRFSYDDDIIAREALWINQPESSAKGLFEGYRIWHLLLPGMVCAALAYVTPAAFFLTLFAVANIFYLSTLAVKFLLFIVGSITFAHDSKQQQQTQKSNKELPVYTILAPLYRETGTLKKLTHAIRSLDYPKAKLDIKLIVEADDHMTIEAIKALKCERIFEIIKVPYSLPRTKPKACNYALRYAKGEFVTIYDAEDTPEPQQLKKALWHFEQGNDTLVCVQARLNYFNRRENLLTRLFALEYASLFDFLLWGVKRMGIPIPLGGTSNHFKLHALKALYAWDPYNVTEDADLGIRIAQHGWNVSVMNSLTLEEAPISLGSWVRQRSRWIKGHMQTYLVHMRYPRKLWKTLGTTGFFGFQFFLGAPCLIFLISPLMWALWGVSAIGLFSLPVNTPIWFEWMIPFNVSIFTIGLVLQTGFAVAVMLRHQWWDMWLSALIFPFYWLLHSIASFKALWQLCVKPYYWEKTTHGVSKVEES